MATRLMCWMFVLALLSAGAANAELVGHGRFNEGTGTVAGDSSGNGNDGTFTGSPQWVPGQLGPAGSQNIARARDCLVVQFLSEERQTIAAGAQRLHAGCLG